MIPDCLYRLRREKERERRGRGNERRGRVTVLLCTMFKKQQNTAHSTAHSMGCCHSRTVTDGVKGNGMRKEMRKSREKGTR
jgi:hypothetical protein